LGALRRLAQALLWGLLDTSTLVEVPVKSILIVRAARFSVLSLALSGLGACVASPDESAPSEETAAADDALAQDQKLTSVYITWYGFNDNSCQVESQHDCNTIAFPKSDGWKVKHEVATEGKGTYDDPITFATAAKDDGSKAEFAPGTRIYVPSVHKYFMMEDQCYECGKEFWGSHHARHVDLWMGPSYGSSDKPLMSCEDKLTLGDTYKGTGVIIANPSKNHPVDQSPLFAGNKCSAHTYPNQ
jgi:hypothetical protein